MLPARMRMYTRACAASLESLLDVYLERLEALSVNQSGYGYLVDEAIRCMEERLHKNSLSLQEVSDYVFVFFIQSPVSGFLIKGVWDYIASSFYQIMERMSKVQL